MPACAFFGEKASARRCASDAQRGLGEAGFWGVALRLLRGSRSLRWAWEGFGAVARRGFATVSMGFWRIGTGRGIAARPHLDRHYLSEFLLVVFLLKKWWGVSAGARCRCAYLRWELAKTVRLLAGKSRGRRVLLRQQCDGTGCIRVRIAVGIALRLVGAYPSRARKATN